jgi:hypothetical protein
LATAAGFGICSNSLFAINPLFVSLLDNNYVLKPCSPAIHGGVLYAAIIGMDTTALADNALYWGAV